MRECEVKKEGQCASCCVYSRTIPHQSTAQHLFSSNHLHCTDTAMKGKLHFYT